VNLAMWLAISVAGNLVIQRWITGPWRRRAQTAERSLQRFDRARLVVDAGYGILLSVSLTELESWSRFTAGDAGELMTVPVRVPNGTTSVFTIRLER